MVMVLVSVVVWCHVLGASWSFTAPLAFLTERSRTCISQDKCKVRHSNALLPLCMTSTEQQELSLDEVTQELQTAQSSFESRLAAADSRGDAESLRVEYLGKKGVINRAMAYMRSLPPQDKPKLGAVVNQIKSDMEAKVTKRRDELEVLDIERQMEKERIDVTLPGLRQTANIGRRHPLSMTMDKCVDIFISLGYDAVTDPRDSPEIETDYYCFEALNCPKDHPSRDMQDTFYMTENREYLLRTHTSSVQIRHMERHKPPFRIVAPGRVYRRDDIDATHSMTFHQVEILAVEERGNLHLGHLKGTVEHFLKNMFGPDIEVRYRGSFFPFTEPSMEVDVFFKGKWLEVLGCGMVDPRVLEMAGIDPEKYSGFAAGFGVERFTMVMHEIDDIREFYNNDGRFLNQFPHFYDDGMYSFLRGKDFTRESEAEREKDRPIASRRLAMDDEELEEMMDGEQENVFVFDTSSAMNANEAAAKAEEEAKQQQQQPQEKQEKKQKKKKKKDKPNNNNANAANTEIDISKFDIRVGQIQNAWIHEDADKLYCEEIDLGNGEVRQICSGLRGHYPLEALVGRKVFVLANLKSRKLAGVPSHGMILCAANEDGSTVKFIDVPEGAEVGERVTVEGYEGEPATENQVGKKKMMDKIFPDLRTDGEGVVVYKGVKMMTSKGACVAEDGMADAQVS